MKNSYRSIKLLGAPLLVAIAISLVGGGAVYAGGRSSTVERAVNSLNDRNSDIMPVPASSGAGAANSNSLLSDADAINSKIYEANKKLGEKAVDTIKEASYTKLPMVGSKGGSTAAKISPAQTVTETITITDTNQVIADADSVAKGTGQNQEWKRGANNQRYFTERIDGVTYIYAGFGVAENVHQSADVINGAIGLAANISDAKVLVRGGIYDGAITINSGVTLYGGYGENGLRNSKTTINLTQTISFSNISGRVEINGFDLKIPPIGRYNSGCVFNGISNVSELVIRNNNITGKVRLNNNTFLFASNTVGGNSLGGGGYGGDLIVYSCTNGIAENNTFNEGVGIWASVGAHVVSRNNNFNNNFENFLVSGLPFGGEASVISTNDYFNGAMRGNYVDTAGSLRINSPAASANIPQASPTKQMTLTNTRYETRTTLQAPQGVYFTISYSKNPSQSTFSLGANTAGKQYTIDKTTVSAFKAMIKQKPENAGESGQKMPNKDMAEGATRDSVIAVPKNDAATEPSLKETVALLRKVLDNPTEEQRQMIDAAKALLNESEETGPESPELAKAREDFGHMLVAAIIAEAMPGLLRKEDITAIQDAFSEFNRLKADVMDKYQMATKGYYDDMKRIIEENSAALDMKGLLTKELLEKGISSLSRQEMNGLLKRMNSLKDKSKEVQHILQEEAKLRVSHNIDKAYAAFIKDMTGVLKTFAKKFYDTLSERGALQASKPVEEVPASVAELPVK